MNLQLDFAKKKIIIYNRRVAKMNDLRAHRLAGFRVFCCPLHKSIDAKHVENHRAVGKLLAEQRNNVCWCCCKKRSDPGQRPFTHLKNDGMITGIVLVFFCAANVRTYLNAVITKSISWRSIFNSNANNWLNVLDFFGISIQIIVYPI